MWSNKKPGTPRAADTEPKKCANESFAKARSSVLRRNTQAEQRCYAPNESDSGWRDIAAGVELVFER